MNDIVKALTDFSVDGEPSTTDDLEESGDIIKALTDFSANDDAEPTSTISVENDTLPVTTAADQNNVVTVSYTQVSVLSCLRITVISIFDLSRVPVQDHLILLMTSCNHRR